MKTLFLCDFDGTLTKSDFYQVVIDHWVGEPGRKYMNEYKEKKPLDYHFLNHIFQMKPMTEDIYMDLVKKIELDPYLKPFLSFLEEKQIDFVLVSAGCRPYISDSLKLQNIEDVRIVTNESQMDNGNLLITPDINSPFYAEPFGIDKAAVASYFRKKYDQIFFAGDSLPDLGAAKEADLIFATGYLKNILAEENIDFIPFSDFSQIIEYLKREVYHL